ncbi:MAG: DegV family protein, partial [Clostridia bacterium]|nr:DegV family protein [Clostridia bacterium]
MVRFIIDSGTDILPEEAAAKGMIHLPLKVTFGEEEYADAVDMNHREFYERLVESDTLPKTSQVSPADFEAAYRQVAEAGDTAVVITISGSLSGTYQSACIAAEGYEGTVFVVDSASVAVGERILVELGLRLRDEGLSAEEIAVRLNEEKHHIRLLALVDTLEYLKKGGRVSKTAAFAGSVLNIKPVLSVAKGEI